MGGPVIWIGNGVSPSTKLELASPGHRSASHGARLSAADRGCAHGAPLVSAVPPPEPRRLWDLPYRDLNTEVGGMEQDAAPGLALDGAHTLVAVEPEDLEALWRPETGSAHGWLLFRSGSAVRAPGTRSDGPAPELWFEVDGRRVDGRLIESAGWGEPGACAVALFEVPAMVTSGAVRSEPRRATCGLRVGEEQIAVELPPQWTAPSTAAPGDVG